MNTLPSSVESALNSVIAAVVSSCPEMADHLRSLDRNSGSYSDDERAALTACAGVAGEVYKLCQEEDYATVKDMLEQMAAV
jgi:hypothetical protein